jgi:FkbM family methyltransferase
MSLTLFRKLLDKNNLFIYSSTESRNYQTLKNIRERIIFNAGGVLHVGAHEGQESDIYAKLGVRVMWIEAIPEKYLILVKNLLKHDNQYAKCILLGSKNIKKHKFYLSSNDKQSSSIYNFGDGNLNSKLKMNESIVLPMKKLSDCFTSRNIFYYPHWVIDVQGAELEVLKGAGKLLDYCYSLEVEVTARDINYYEGGASIQEVINFLKLKGFTNLQDHERITHGNLIFIRVRSS